MNSGIKIAVIGGGSSYTPELVEGILKRNTSLPVSELVLVDIPEGAQKLEIITALVKRMIKKLNLEILVHATFDRRDALKDCNFVITQFRQGGLKGRALDEKIPLSHGMIGQETTGAGGFALAMRTIPVILSIALEMEELCKDAWLVNFTNPSGIITEAVNKHTSIKCIGLCNVPINMHKDAADAFSVDPQRVYCEFIGLNHLSFIKRVFVDGIDSTEELFKLDRSKRQIVANIPEVPGSETLIPNLMLLPSPYLNYYYFEEHMLLEEHDSIKKGLGTRAEVVMKSEKELFDLYKDENLAEKPEQLSERGGSMYSEAAISLIETLYTGVPKVHVLNVVNNGALPELPLDCVVEVNCLVNSSGAFPLASGKLPEVVKGLISTVKNYESKTIEAAVEESKLKAFQALLSHPLVHGAEKAAILLEEIITAHNLNLK